MSNSDVIPLHLAKGIVVYSIFKWIAITLSDENTDTFSYQLAKQHDEKILKHIRKYIISKLHVADVNIPLFIHAIGVLDAFQMLRCFTILKNLHFRYKFIANYFRRKRLLRYFRTFSSIILKEKRLKELYRIILYYSSHKCLKETFDNWRESFHLHYVWNNFVYPKLLKKHFYSFSSRVQTTSFQRQLYEQIEKFCCLKQKKLRWNKWLSRLSKIASIQRLTDSQTLKNWILSYMKIHSLCRKSKGSFKQHIDSHQFLSPVSGAEQHKNNAFAYSRVMKIAVINEQSMLCQKFFLSIGTLFSKYRSIGKLIWRWQTFCAKSKHFRRVPKEKTISVHERLFVPFHEGFPNLQKCSYYLKKWCRSAMRSSFLSYVSMKTSAQHKHRILLMIFRHWLVASASSQMLKRRGHQLYVIHSNNSLKRHFLVWRGAFDKAFIDKINQRQMIELRERQAEMYLALFRDRREEKLKIYVFRNWVKFTKLCKYGQVIFHLRMKYYVSYNGRLLKYIWQHWKSITSESTIVDCVKALWFGFKCRHVSHSSSWKYQYLKWYKRQIPKIFYIRKKYCKRRVFLALWKYSQIQKHLHKTLLTAFKQKKVIRKLWKNLQFRKRLNVASQNTQSILFVQILKSSLNKLQTLVLQRKYMRDLASKFKLKQYSHFLRQLRNLRYERQTISISKSHRNHRLKLKYFLNYWYQFSKERTHSYESYKLVVLRRKQKFLTRWKFSYVCHNIATSNMKRRQMVLSRKLLRFWIQRRYAQKNSTQRGSRQFRKFMTHSFFCRWVRFVTTKAKHSNRWINLYKRLFPGEKKVRMDTAHVIAKRSYKGVVRHVQTNAYRATGNDMHFMNAKFSWALRLMFLFKRWKVFISSRNLCRKKISVGRNHRKTVVRKICRAHFRHWLHFIVKKKLRASKDRRISQMHLYTLYVRSFHRWKALRRMRSRIRFILYKKYPIQFPHKYFRLKCSAALQKLKDRVNRRRKKVLGMSFPQKPSIHNGNQNRLRVIRKLKIRMQHFIAALQLLVDKKKHPQRKNQRKIILKKEFNSFLHNFLKWKRFVKKLRVKRMISYYSIVHYQNSRRLYVLEKWFSWTRIRQKFYKIRKRFYVVPIFDKWLKCTVSHFQNRRIVDTMQSRINFRVKRQILLVWKIFTNQSKQATLKYLTVQRKHFKALKQTYMNVWMIQLDTKILQTKHDKVQYLINRKILTLVLRNWYKLSLLNEIITWKNTKKGLLHWKQLSKTWHKQHLRSYYADRYYLRRNLNIFLQKLKDLIVLHSNFVARRGLSRNIYGGKSFHNIHRSISSRSYPRTHPIVSFSSSVCLQLTIKRYLAKWKSSTLLRRSKKRKILVKKIFHSWKQYSHFVKFVKQAFISRMDAFLHRYYLQYGFNCLLSLHRRKLLGNQIKARDKDLQLAFYYKRWLLMFHRRQYSRSQVSALIQHIYLKSLPVYFVIWKVKVSIGLRLSRSTLLKRSIEKWKKLFVAHRYCRFIHMIKVFNAWRELVETKNNNVRLFQRRKFSLFELFSRFNQRFHREVKDTFIAWKETTESTKENIDIGSNTLS